jgi:hypothetical protein
MLQQAGLHQVVGLTHLQAQGLGLVGACNQAAVVVAEHHYRAGFQPGLKNPLAGHIKVIAVNESVHANYNIKTLQSGSRGDSCRVRN